MFKPIYPKKRNEKYVFTVGFLLYFPVQVFSLDGDTSVTQGLLIANKRNDVTVFINGQNYDKFMLKKISLPSGRYKIIGKRENCFPDYERVKIDSNAITLVTLNPKPFQIHLSPKLDVIFVGRNYCNLGACFNAGYRTIRHYFGAFAFYTMSQEFLSFGLNYNYILFENRFFIVEPGVLAGYAKFYEAGDALFYETYWDEYYYEEHPDKRNRFRSISIGPKIMLQYGLEHVKLGISYSLLFSKLIIQSIEVGLNFNF